MAICDNTGEDEKLALRIHKVVKKQAMSGFRDNQVVIRRITLVHECFHWYRHQPYHVLMRMIGADDNLGRVIQCQIVAGTTDSDKWKAVDWMEWQAKGVALKILMPEKTVRPLVDKLLAEYTGKNAAADRAWIY